MIRIDCPFCGPRDHGEFTYAGDATKVRPAHGSTDMEAWLDYVYYSSESLRLVAYQEPMTEEQAQLVYKDGDALPNAWHPSDHLPVGCVFELL